MVSNLLSLMAGDSPCDHGLGWICWDVDFKRCFSGNDGKNAGHWALQIQQLPSLTDHQHDQIKSKCAVFYLLFPPGFVATNRAHLSSRRRQWRRGNIADASGMWIECSVCISTLQTWCCCGAQRVVQDVPFVWLLWSTYILRGASLCCGDEQCWPPFREIFIDFLLLPVWATGVSHRKWWTLHVASSSWLATASGKLANSGNDDLTWVQHRALYGCIE